MPPAPASGTPTPSSSGLHLMRSLLRLEYPRTLGTFEEYAAAQRMVDHLSDQGFPVENCMIVGTELKQVERITGRLTTGRVAAGGALSGFWLGMFVGLILAMFGEDTFWPVFVTCALFGAVFGVIWALFGYALTRGQRDFRSVSQIVATRYEVLVEHKLQARAAELVKDLPEVRQAAFGE